MAQKTKTKSQSASKKTVAAKATSKNKSVAEKPAMNTRKPVSGKEKQADQLAKTRVQLLKEAKAAGLTGISRLTKDQLVKSLSKVR